MRSLRVVGLTLGLFGLLGAGPASAALIFIENAGFEAEVLADQTSVDIITGWSFLGSPTSGTFNPGTAVYPGEAPEGQNVAYSNEFGGFISQELSGPGSTLTANTRYTLSIEVGNRVGGGFPGYEVELLAGGTVLASDLNTLLPDDGTFETSVIDYLAEASDPNLGETLEIRFRALGTQVNFDDVKLDAMAVPEPSSLALMMFGTLGLAAYRGRRS